MAEAESEEALRLRNKAPEMRKSPTSKIYKSHFLKKSFMEIALPFKVKNTSKEPKSSYFLTKSLAEMLNEDPIRIQNQSCVIREEIVKTLHGKQLVFSSLARLSTFSVGLSSTQGEDPLRARLYESSVDSEDKSQHRYFQMPELGARVFVGDRDGFDTIACHLFDGPYDASKFYYDAENAAVKSVYKDDHPGGLSGWLQAHPGEFWRSHCREVVLTGTELFVGPLAHGAKVGNLGGRSSKEFGFSSDYKDCTGDETTTQLSDIVELPEDLVPSVDCHGWRGYWGTIEGPDLFRSPKGSYLTKPKFVNLIDLDLWNHPAEGSALHLTRFDDFVILGTRHFYRCLFPHEVIDIVRKNASETADIIAAQLVKGAMKESRPLPLWPITAIVIFLDHKEIFGREHKKEKKESQEEGKITTLKEDEEVFASQMEFKKRIEMEEDDVGETLAGDLLPNLPQISSISLEENELEMKSTTISSNHTSTKVQDVSKDSSSVVLIEDDDCKSEEFIISHHITKWIIYGDLLKRTLLCFFNIEEEQYEFYFEDYDSMATIIGLGVPHSKVILECGSPHVTVVEIPKEDWDVAWAQSNVIPYSIPKVYVLKQEIFPDILHHIANVINSNNIVSEANNGGIGGDNGKGKAQNNVDDRKGKGKAHDHDDHGNIGHPNGGSNGGSDDNDKNKKKGENGKDDKEDFHDGDDGMSFSDCKEVQGVVYLRLLSGGVLQEKKKELGEVYEGVEKKKKNREVWWYARKRGENGNVVNNHQKRTTTEGVENGDVDEELLKELENQIHSQMVFTFTIKDEAGGQLKTIQATIDPITFQFPPNNKKNYLQRRRFGWFHKKLKVAFGVVDAQVANLEAKSCKVLDSSEAEEVNSQSNSNGSASTSTNACKGAIGMKYVVIASGEYNRTNGSESKRNEEVQNSWKTNKTLTKCGFSILEHTNLNSQQLKYSYHPHFPFKEKAFEVIDEDDRLKMYEDPICQLQRVSCEGTWYPVDSENLEAYKLEARRELGMTRIFNLEQETREEKQRKLVWKAKPLCFIQKLEKVVYLNHAMSHLTSSTTGVFRLQERKDPSNPSSKILTHAQKKEEPKWPSNDPLVDVRT